MQPCKAVLTVLGADDAQDAFYIGARQQREQEMSPNLARGTCEELRNSTSAGFSPCSLGGKLSEEVDSQVLLTTVFALVGALMTSAAGSVDAKVL